MKAYILPSCSTCNRILKQLEWSGETINIKAKGVPASLLTQIKAAYGSYEVAFSRRAMKYKSMGLKDKKLSDNDIKMLILSEYTFLKRPVFEVNGQLFIGNSAKVVAEVKAALQ